MSQNRQLRDLDWALNSESLIDSSPTIGNADVDIERIDVAHLSAFIDKSNSHRVGRYFERLILYWLRYVRRLGNIQHGLQLHEANRTIGEIDFLFRDEQQRLTHWETAVKFYLHYPIDNPTASHFVGPNAADTFEKKMRRLFEHQLPLSKSRFPDVEIREPIVKGRIFYHPQYNPPAEMPQWMSPNHLRGTWIRSSQLDYFDRNTEVFGYQVMHKPHWLSAEVAMLGESSVWTGAQLISHLKTHFQQTERPILINMMARQAETYAETNRIFVVSDHWPS